jgi:hypothetical protein
MKVSSVLATPGQFADGKPEAGGFGEVVDFDSPPLKAPLPPAA